MKRRCEDLDTNPESDLHEEEDRKIAKLDEISEEKSNFVGKGGFESYSKVNPFAVQANSQPIGGFSKINPSMAISIPSSSSPKVNPFQSTSPAHNPFMTIVEKQDDLWRRFSSGGSEVTAPQKPLSTGSSTFSSFSFGGLGSGNSSFGNSKFFTAQPLFGSAPTSVKSNNESEQTTPCNSRPTSDNDSDGEGSDNESDKDKSEEESELAVSGSANAVWQPAPSVQLETGEEGEQLLLQVRCKMFRLGKVASKKQDDHVSSNESDIKDGNDKQSNEWVEVGTGPLKLLLGAANGSASGYHRLVMRRECQAGGHGTKVILNLSINKYSKTAKLGEKALRISCLDVEQASSSPEESNADASEKKVSESDHHLQAVTYLFRTKTAQEIDKLFGLISSIIKVDPVIASPAGNRSRTNSIS